MDSVKAIEYQAAAISREVESQSLNAVVAGFSFASAIAWMDLVRFIISQVINVPKNGGTYFALTALLTTLLSVLVYMGIARVSKEVKRPAAPIYAVSA